MHSLNGIDLWDGRTARGRVSLTWNEGRFASGVNGGATAGGVFDRIDTASDVSAYGPERALDGLSVVPGLIDTHVHLIGNASDTPADFLGWPLVTRPEEQVLHGLAHAQRALAAGVTTLRDLAADEIQISLRRALDAGIVTGPRLIVNGLVSMTGGHGDMFTPPAVENRKRTADGPWECRALVRHWARAGADGIKIATSGGVLSADRSSWRNHTGEEIDAIVDEAHALGLRVAAHAHTEEGIAIALRHGVDSIEHGTLISREQAVAATTSGVSIAPTLLINDAIAERRVPVSDDQAAKAAALINTRNELMRDAATAGADFVLGTDANGYHVGFGDQMAEVRRMGEVLGYSPERALEAATSRAAETIGLGSQVGTIDIGFGADFLVMRGRPWLDLDDLRVENIVAVVSRGIVVAGALPEA